MGTDGLSFVYNFVYNLHKSMKSYTLAEGEYYDTFENKEDK